MCYSRVISIFKQFPKNPKQYQNETLNSVIDFAFILPRIQIDSKFQVNSICRRNSENTNIQKALVF